jgi:hypothetical protein
MDADGIAMKIALAVIIGVLAFLVYRWWQGQSIEKMDAPVASMAVPMPSPPPSDPVPQGPGVIMYGNNDCPWCQKQKTYFEDKKMDYQFIDCSTPGVCPNFVHGFPTIVKDGNVMPGYQEL